MHQGHTALNDLYSLHGELEYIPVLHNNPGQCGDQVQLLVTLKL